MNSESKLILRNLPNEYSFYTFHNDGELRKNYFMKKLKQNNFIRNIEWLRTEQDVMSY
jgi:hypothetical protein